MNVMGYECERDVLTLKLDKVLRCVPADSKLRVGVCPSRTMLLSSNERIVTRTNGQGWVEQGEKSE